MLAQKTTSGAQTVYNVLHMFSTHPKMVDKCPNTHLRSGSHVQSSYHIGINPGQIEDRVLTGMGLFSNRENRVEREDFRQTSV